LIINTIAPAPTAKLDRTLRGPPPAAFAKKTTRFGSIPEVDADHVVQSGRRVTATPSAAPVGRLAKVELLGPLNVLADDGSPVPTR
jgi:hypothetical protein